MKIDKERRKSIAKSQKLSEIIGKLKETDKDSKKLDLSGLVNELAERKFNKVEASK